MYCQAFSEDRVVLENHLTKNVSLPNIKTAAWLSKLTKPKLEPQAQRKVFFVPFVEQHPTSLTTVRRNTQN